ncbi:HNH endonuclease family protein [Streptomyces bohaiensis]|nr:HNH endonuclease family protein [Streptomyces bohaiensis]
MTRMRRHQLIVGTLAVALAATLTGCGEEGLSLPSPEDISESAPGDSAPEGGSSETTLPNLPGAQEGRTMLGELTVAEEGSMAGYSRDEFPHWQSTDGCTARQHVLIRDGVGVETDDNCQPQAGEWYSEFDGETLTAAADVDIDHIVPLAAAWRSGADSWDRERRREFGNDLENPQLIAVSQPSNRSKGDQTPADWRPMESYWCDYALAWTATKHTYELTVTDEEHEALTEMLDTCG